jgi:hypothetical protein
MLRAKSARVLPLDPADDEHVGVPHHATALSHGRRSASDSARGGRAAFGGGATGGGTSDSHCSSELQQHTQLASIRIPGAMLAGGGSSPTVPRSRPGAALPGGGEWNQEARAVSLGRPLRVHDGKHEHHSVMVGPTVSMHELGLGGGSSRSGSVSSSASSSSGGAGGTRSLSASTRQGRLTSVKLVGGSTSSSITASSEPAGVDARRRWHSSFAAVAAARRFVLSGNERRARREQAAALEDKKRRILADRRRGLGGGRGSGSGSGSGSGVGAFVVRRAGGLMLKDAIDRMTHGWSSPSQVTAYIYLGDRTDAAAREKLHALGITHVLNVARGLPAAHEAEFMYQQLPLVDNDAEDIAAHFEEAFRFIRDARACGGAVLVHCVAGVSRSVTLVAAWLVAHERYTLKQAMDLVRGARCTP